MGIDQVLNIPTKINKGTVEIITPVEIVKKGDKVGSSESALLSKLGIKPFSYGLIVQSVYDNGSVFDPEVLNLTEDDLAMKFALGLSNVASISMALLYPTIAAAPHMFINTYKNVLSVAMATEYSFPMADKVKEYLEVFTNANCYTYCPFDFCFFFILQIYTDDSSCRIQASLQLLLLLLQVLHLLLQFLLPRRRRRKNLRKNLMKIWVLGCLIE